MAEVTLVNSNHERSQKVFKVIEDLIKPDSTLSISTAAETIDACVRNDTELEGALWGVWGIFLDVAQRLDYGYPGHAKLVELVKALGALPPRTIHLWEEDTVLWSDYPLLGPSVREAWDYTDHPSDEERTQWLRLNSFVARLMGQSIADLSIFAVWQLREALETDEHSDQDACIAFLVVAEWIDHAGTAIYRQAQLDEPEFNGVSQGGPLFKGKSGLTVLRWHFWKDRLEQCSKQRNVDLDLQEVARGVWARMNIIEKENPK